MAKKGQHPITAIGWIILIAIFVFLIATFIILFQFMDRGCSRVVCNEPYIQVGSGCCLDNNDNAICDQDEVEPTIQGLSAEFCSVDGIIFSCVWSFITQDEIQFKLQSKIAGVTVITRIEIPNANCGIKYEDTLEDGLKFNEIKQFNIPCNFTRDYVRSKMRISFTSYPKEGFKDENTTKEWTGYDRSAKVDLETREIDAWIEGIIR